MCFGLSLTHSHRLRNAPATLAVLIYIKNIIFLPLRELEVQSTYGGPLNNAQRVARAQTGAAPRLRDAAAHRRRQLEMQPRDGRVVARARPELRPSFAVRGHAARARRLVNN